MVRHDEKGIGATSAAADVFVSYASPDTSVAEAACAAIEQSGAACWIAPRDVTPGASYAGEIIHAIDAAKVIVLILSRSAVSSAHVLREVERAASKGHPILALRIDAAPLAEDFQYFLNTSQWLDAGVGGVAKVLPKLVSAVRLAIDAPLMQQPSSPANAAATRTGRLAKRTAIVAASAMGLALAIFAADRWWLSGHTSRTPDAPAAQPSTEVSAPAVPKIQEKSVAVLPFVDMSEKKDHEYFSDGLSEELIEHLAHAPDLKVIARTSSFQFKGKSEDARTIAAALGVANLLEGSVRTSGKLVRVTVQLIRASDGSHLWSESYDRNVSDIFKVQDEIAATVVRALKAKLSGSADSGGKEPTIDAYTHLLKGNYLSVHGHQGDTDRAIEQYKLAIKADPNYALAWAKLGRQYMMKAAVKATLVPSAAEIQARDALAKALSIDPNLPTAYRWLGRIEMNIHWNWAAAKANFERAIALDPSSPDGTYAQADLWIMTGLLTGNLDAAIKFNLEQSARDPLDTHLLFTSSWILDDAGRTKEALAKLDQLEELDPGFEGISAFRGSYLLELHDWSGAKAHYDKEPDGPAKLEGLAILDWMTNRKAEADTALHKLEDQYAGELAYDIASIHFIRQEKDLGFTWLDRAYAQHDANMLTLKVDSSFDGVRMDERYRAMLRKMQMSDSS